MPRNHWMSDRGSCWLLAGVVTVYVAAFAAFYPRTTTVIDELGYLREAQVLATGVGHEAVTNPFTGATIVREIYMAYPLGTAITIAPFFALGGWQLSFVAPASCLLAAVLLVAVWLRSEGRSPWAASILLAFPPALVLGRVCMSEAPSLCWVSLGLLLFWRGLAGRRVPCWLLAGFIGGAALLFRESNVLLFAPLFAGAALRRDASWWALLVGGLAGVGARLASGFFFWGDPFYYKSPGYPFGPASILPNLPLYTFALLVMVPGGLAAGLLYRGPRWPELVATVVLFVGFYHLYDYRAESSGIAKQLILGPRFFVPLLPVLAFALAEVVPRTWRTLEGRFPERGAALCRVANVALGIWVLGLVSASVGAHAAHASWSSGQATMQEAIYHHTPDRSVIISNSRALVKFINPLYGDRSHLDRDRVGPRLAAALLDRNEVVYLVLLDRSDSDHWRRDARANEAYIQSFVPRPRLTLDLVVSRTDRLRIFEVREIRGRL